MDTLPLNKLTETQSTWSWYTNTGPSGSGSLIQSVEQLGSRLRDRSVLKWVDPFSANVTQQYTRLAVTRERFSCASMVSLFPGDPFASVGGQYIPDPTWDAQFMADFSAQADAKGKLVKKLHSVRNGSFDGLLFAAEAGKTWHMIGEKGSLVSDHYDRFAKEHQPSLDSARRRAGSARGRIALKQTLKRITGRYLELMYGVLPLLSDIDSAAKDIAAHLNPGATRPRVLRVSAQSRVDSGSLPITGESLGTTGYNYYWTQIWARDVYTYFYHGAYLWSNTYDGASPRSALGLLRSRSSVVDFVPTIYEVIPYSFLVDYFVNIGGLAYALTLMTDRVTIYSRSNKSERYIVRKVRDGNKAFYGPSATSIAIYPAIGAQTIGSRFIRDSGGEHVLDNLLCFQIPGSRKLANVAALAINRFTR